MRETDIRLLMEISPDRELRPGWQRGVEIQRTRTIKAGDLLYCSSYPIWDTATRRDAQQKLDKAEERKGTSDAQRKLNARKAEEKLVQLINANFGTGDHLVTYSYAQDKKPEDMARAQKDMKNYLARLKRLCRRNGLPDPEYVYVTTNTCSNRWGKNYHHHMALKTSLPRETVEELWIKQHGICNTKRAQPGKEGLTGWAKYMADQPCSVAEEKRREADGRSKHAHRWAASKGLKIPAATEADKKISRRRVEKIAMEIKRDPDLARLHMEACYPGYEVLELNVKTSEWVTGAYVYAVMCRKELDGIGGKTKCA